MIRLFLTILLFLFAQPAIAEKRVAFLLGNANYENAPLLTNPARDVRLIAQTLTSLGFLVTLHEDLTRDATTAAFTAFLRDNFDADLTLFYYAGHGLQFEGQNYLVGTDAKLVTELDIASETVPLNQMVRLLERQSKAALIFIDACRNNPLADRFYTENFSQTRAISSRGLAPVNNAFSGSMLVFSASPGQVAFDGELGNSPFSTALAKHLPAENIEVLSLMKRVIADVKISSGDQQVPMVVNDLTTEIYLNLGSNSKGNTIAYQQEEAMFEAAMQIGSERAWQIYFQRYPNGQFHEMAQLRIEQIQNVEPIPDADATKSAANSKPSLKQAVQAERNLGIGQAEAKQIQAALNGLGYDAGPVDGSLGQKSRKAIADYQLAIGLPSSGVVTAATAERLGVKVARAETSDIPIYSSRNAQRYDPDQLALLETDKRLLKAAKTLTSYDFVYGFFEGRLYIAVQTWQLMSKDQAIDFATKAGGYLATLTSSAENQFVYNLVKDDSQFWQKHTRGHSTTFGPSIGLFQKVGAREPDGGWEWITGEPLKYQNWSPGEPGNSDNNEFFASLMWDVYPRTGESFNTSPKWGDFPHSQKSLIIEIE